MKNIIEFLADDRAIVSLKGLYRVHTLHRGVVLNELLTLGEAKADLEVWTRYGGAKTIVTPYEELPERLRCRRW